MKLRKGIIKMEIYEIIALILLGMAVILLVISLIFNEESAVKRWLLCAVTLAEKEFGSGCGTKKLKWVYGKFSRLFPVFAVFVSFDTFSRWVDIALDYMCEALQSVDELNIIGENTGEESTNED